MNIYDLIQERAGIYDQLKALMDQYDGKEMDPVDRDKYDRLDAEFDRLTKTIEDKQKLDERAKLIDNAMDKAPAKKDELLFAKALSGDAMAMAAYRNSAPTLGTDSQAGYLTAPVQFVDELIKGLNDSVFMRQISHITPKLGAGQSLGFPYLATDAADASWTGEVDAAAEETTIAFGRREFKPNRLAKLIKVSKTLMNHAPMAESTLKEACAFKLSTAMENAYMTGNGTGKPLGIFIASNDGISTSRDVNTGSTTDLTADGLIDIQMAVKQQYQQRAAWVMHRDVAKLARKLKDSNNRYYWEPSLVPGQPDMLLGKPVYMSEFAPNTVSSGNYGLVYGDFNFYWICDCDTMEVQVLRELYATTNQIGYLWNYAGDGAPVVAEAFARGKFAAN